MERSHLLSQIILLENDILEKKKQLAELRQAVPEQLISNYEFVSSTGTKIYIITRSIW